MGGIGGPPKFADANAAPDGLTKLHHFVFIMQENRSFDSYFGTYPGADGIPRGICLAAPSGGQCVAPYHDPSLHNRGGPHDHTTALAEIDGGKMDGFLAGSVRAATSRADLQCLGNRSWCEPGQDPRDVMGWHDSREIPNYWTYAHNFVLQDHLFSSAASFTLPNRLAMLTGQPGEYTLAKRLPARFDVPEITERLSRAKVDWKYYVTTGREIDPASGKVVDQSSLFEADPNVPTYLNPLAAFPRVLADPESRRRLVDTTTFYDDARAGRLPAVSWIVPSMALSEHPPANVRQGMAYVTGLVNALMAGPDWSSTAIFIAYDEWGGFYDHVPPPTIEGELLGPRVPGLVISPFARTGYIDHQVYTPISWLSLIEERYRLDPLTNRDARALDMTDAFDFGQAPRPPLLLNPNTNG